MRAWIVRLFNIKKRSKPVIEQLHNNPAVEAEKRKLRIVEKQVTDLLDELEKQQK